MLHGHNYQVSVSIAVPPEEDWAKTGYFVDFNVFKKHIKACVDSWDEHVLLPKNHKDMKFSERDASLEVRFRDRFYVFPKKEVHLLPVTNTSVEQLSKLLAEEFLKEFKKYGVQKLRVSVEETRGQSASYVVKA